MVHIDPAFVTDGVAAEPVQPRKAAFDHPSVLAQLFANIDTPPCDARLDVAADGGASATTMVIGFVGVQLVGSASWSTALAGNRRHSVKQFLQRHAIVYVGPVRRRRAECLGGL